jgi:AGZA family xanthine/uracil permease-like MFS transporter
MMMQSVVHLKWDDFSEVMPAFLAMITMPLTYSISTGIAVGFVIYPIVKVLTGRAREVHWIVYVLGALFIYRFAFLAG